MTNLDDIIDDPLDATTAAVSEVVDLTSTAAAELGEAAVAVAAGRLRRIVWILALVVVAGGIASLVARRRQALAGGDTEPSLMPGSAPDTPRRVVGANG